MRQRHKYSEYGYMRAADGYTWRPLSDGPFAARETPGREQVAAGIKPACEGCRIASHGFLCHFANGQCLKTINGGRKNDALGDAGAGAASESG